jgi:putative membrane protein
VGTWSFEAGPLALLAVLAAGFVRRRRLIPGRRQAAFALGWILLVVALVSPLAAWGERRLAPHMAQHLLLGDLAPLALAAGVTGRALRPLLVIHGVRALRRLAHPAVALPLWAVDLAVWHVPGLYDLAVRNEAVHAVEHLCFLAAGLALWAPVVESLPSPAWFGAGARLGYVLAARACGMALGNVFLFAGAPLYYGSLADQRAAGGVMLAEGTLVSLAAFAWFFLRLVQEEEQRERLVELGVPRRAASRAARFGRAPGA